MKAFSILVILFIFNPYLFSQWEWQNPSPFGNGLTEIQFLNSSVGYACGYGGTIIKTIDGGENWIALENDINDLIIDIFFITEETGWLITYNFHEIYKTTNGGEDWEVKGNLSPRYATSIWFIDEMKGFASGYQYLLSTSDGGSTWEEINSVYLTNEIYFLDSKVGFVGGFNVIFKTTNGGSDWSNISLPTSEFTPGKIFALDQNKIFIVGTGFFQGNQYFSFIRSTNGGNNWNGANFDYWLTDVYFKTTTEGWVCSDKIYKTMDQGNNWAPTDFSADNFSFYENQAWAINGRNVIIHSDDFWITADQQIKSVFSGFLWNGVAKDSNVVFGCGSNKTIVGSFDGGKTWEKYFQSTDDIYLNSLTFINNSILSVGSGGTIVISTDYGNTWKEENINASWLSDIEFLNNNLGYIVGSINGLACIYITQNGGKSWELQQTFPEYTTIDGIKFSSEKLGWMIANRDGILKSVDMGKTWNLAYDSIPWCEDIAVSGDTAWFSYSNKILRTTDAGTSWETFNVFGYQGTAFWGFAFDFVNSNIGYAGTWDGRIFKSVNGGVTWEEEDFPSTMPIYGLDFISEKKGWTFGESGTILIRDPNYVFVENANVSTTSNYYLSQNYPNPFNPVTTLRFTIIDLQFVTLKVYDILGREIATLVNEEKSAGDYEIEFDASNLSSGIYFYRLKAGDFVKTKKMVLIR